MRIINFSKCYLVLKLCEVDCFVILNGLIYFLRMKSDFKLRWYFVLVVLNLLLLYF